jgi:CBS domain-containing protein
MRCMDVMKRELFVVGADDTVRAAAQRMRNANIGFLPVTDASDRVIGVLTDRDIAMRVTAADRLASSCRVGEVMTAEVVCCRATDDLSRAEELMSEHMKSRLLVTSEEGFLQGVLSLSDIAQHESPRRTGVTIREVTAREALW